MKGLKANSSDTQNYQHFFRRKLLCGQPNLLNMKSNKVVQFIALKLRHLN